MDNEKVKIWGGGEIDWLMEGLERPSGCCPHCEAPTYGSPSFFRRHLDTFLSCHICKEVYIGAEGEGVPDAEYAMSHEVLIDGLTLDGFRK